MNRSNKRRRKAIAKQVRTSRTQIYTALSNSDSKTLHRFSVQGGVLTGANVLYSDEEAE